MSTASQQLISVNEKVTIKVHSLEACARNLVSDRGLFLPMAVPLPLWSKITLVAEEARTGRRLSVSAVVNGRLAMPAPDRGQQAGVALRAAHAVWPLVYSIGTGRQSSRRRVSALEENVSWADRVRGLFAVSH